MRQRNGGFLPAVFLFSRLPLTRLSTVVTGAGVAHGVGLTKTTVCDRDHMKKKRGKSPKPRKAPTQSTEPSADGARSGRSRRDTLRLLRNGALIAAGLGAVGFGVTSVQATMAEHDLTRIGKGIPAIVQIHDPQCSLCLALQKQTRKALRRFDSGDVTYLVANINTPEGAALAARYAVPHVTLLLFDGDGDMRQIVRGPSTRDVLETTFAEHLDATQPGS